MLTPAWFKLKPHPKQIEAYWSPARFVFLRCGRASGKTMLARRNLIRKAMVTKPWKDPRSFYAGPTLKHVKKLAWYPLLDLIPRQMLDVRNTHIGGPVIALINGHRIHLIGLEDPKRAEIEGLEWDDGVVDESADVPPGVVSRIILPAMAHRRGGVWRIGVPKRQGIGAAEFNRDFKRAMSGKDPDAAAFSWASSDILPASEIEVFRRKLDERDFMEQIGGLPADIAGTVFHAFSEAYNLRPVIYNPRQPIIVGCDFNVDPMCWVIGHRYADRLEWFDELWIRGTNTLHTLNRLWERYQAHGGGWEFYGDATSAARKTSASFSDYQHIMNDTRFTRAGRTLHFPDSNPAVADRISACNAMFCNANGERRMFIDPVGCPKLVEDIGNRAYKEGTNELADPKGGLIGHMTDAMGYPVMMLFPPTIILDDSDAPVFIRR